MVEPKEIFDSLDAYITKNDFKGYDPYDTLNSLFPFEKLGRWTQIIAIQIQKRNPINIRPLIGVKKFHSTKGMGLLLTAYLNAYSISKDEKYIPKIEKIKNWLLDNSGEYEGAICWGYDYPYTERGGGSLLKGFPTVIHHSYILKALSKYHELFGDKQVLKVIFSCEEFVVKALKRHEFSEGICFSYDPNATGCCYNASMHAAECLARIYALNKDPKLYDLIIKAVDFVTSRQNEDGSWYYSFKDINGPQKNQIDFHQGFILESYKDIVDLIGTEKKSWNLAVYKGINFYQKNQFKDSGKSYWRLPHEFPIDIHNQSQGIITFSKFGQEEADYQKFANKILDWTVAHMRNEKKGYFYYRINKYFTNRISYMRWSQSWMLLAISELLLINLNTIDREKN